MTLPNNVELLRAIKVLHISDNPKTRATLYDALLGSTLILPLANEDVPTGQVDIHEGLQLDLVQAHNSQGDPLILAFTDMESLTRWESEPLPYIVIPAQPLFTMLSQQHAPMLMLNIAGTIGGEITQVEIQALGQGLHPTAPNAVDTESIDEQIEVRITPPHVRVSPHLPTYLKQVFGKYEAVESAYIFSLHRNNEPAALTLGVNLTGDATDIDTILREVASVIPPAIVEDGLQLMPLQGEMLDFVQMEFPAVYQAT